jgi:GTP-binding protein HflX
MEGSDVLIHLVDASNSQYENHIASVEKILEELHLSGIPRLLVFNKADLLDESELQNMRRAHKAVTISALDRNSIMPMIERIGEMLDSAASGQVSGSDENKETGATAPIT